MCGLILAISKSTKKFVRQRAGKIFTPKNPEQKKADRIAKLKSAVALEEAREKRRYEELVRRRTNIRHAF